MITMLADYQVEHLVHILGIYRRTLTKELAKPFKSKKEKAFLREELTITDEIADMINGLSVETDTPKNHEGKTEYFRRKTE